LRWEPVGVEGLIGRCVAQCDHLVDHRWHAASIASGSGRRSPTASRARRLGSRPVCLRRSELVGSVKVVECQQSAALGCRAASCPLSSGKRSLSCMPRTSGARDRSAAGSIAVVDLAGAPRHRGDPWRPAGGSGHDRPLARRSAGRRPKLASSLPRGAAMVCAGSTLGHDHGPDGAAVAGPAVRWDRSPAWGRSGPPLGDLLEPRTAREPAPGRLPDDGSMRIFHEAIAQACTSRAGRVAS
jgi:hypothetical protein